ncbi:uncharacterized protein BO66DRAFT_440092 [Aspergillus aculeatinus CBS 121060]|uniref:Uncharacterized protein n=1 Tax=Aspergillus aculeatinus CBS 121060 TaxID=1448322 RepID=A0ACD1H417_9EURO|nr:hypothetical protein BO66DRAFT_440092 [Aspergillus aculeatinus CBS 121060]RAH68476.1 hypothetical protein BO66DRAFT_440092 [Aspergillus aculeatinus CBS 121060]
MGDTANEHDQDTDGDFESAVNSPDLASGGLSWDLGLAPAGDAASSFRVQNDPRAPYQRSNVIERKGTIDIRCSCLDVVHGIMNEHGPDRFATLLVLEFRFDVRKRARRIEGVQIALEFRAREAGEAGPEVYKIAPDGNFSLVPTSQREDIKRSVSGQAGASAPVGGLSITGTVGWEKTVSRDRQDHCTVVGSRDLVGRNWGSANSASWTLLEKKSAQSGVPSLLRTAILLRREDEQPFECVVKLTADVVTGWRERLWGGKGRVPKDDPVLFDPLLDPTNHLREFDVYNLGQVDLEGLCRVTHQRNWQDAPKH